MSTLVRDGALISKDPQAKRTVTFDWDEELNDDAEIASQTLVITGPDNLLTQDTSAIVSGARQTSVRLLGGTVGATYTVTNHIVTNETPAQEDDASVKVFIRNR